MARSISPVTLESSIEARIFQNELELYAHSLGHGRLSALHVIAYAATLPEGTYRAVDALVGDVLRERRSRLEVKLRTAFESYKYKQRLVDTESFTGAVALAKVFAGLRSKAGGGDSAFDAADLVAAALYLCGTELGFSLEKTIGFSYELISERIIERTF